MPACTIGYGKVNFPNSSMTISALTVEKPFVTKLPKFQAVGAPVAIPSSERPDITGTVYLQNMDIPEGTLLMVKAGKTYKGRSIADAALFLRVRESAAGIVIKVLMPESGNSLLPNSRHTCFSGRADIISVDEAVAQYGIVVRATMRSAYFNQEEQDEIFQVAQFSPEVAPRPVAEVVVNSDGKEVVLVSSARTRRVRVRRD